ncbi:MAG: GTPase Era [Gammaproteobacteria bacterium]|nr:GTPase Era [Gammaproteobacteria bacterium]
MAFRAGFVAVSGRPNAGKSTLVNAMVGQRIAIVSRRPQATRRALRGIVNGADFQIVLVDSPGLHGRNTRALNRALNSGAKQAAVEADAILFVIEAGRWQEDDERALALIRETGRPAVLALNKIDRVHPREALLPMIAEAQERHDFSAIIPVSALRGDNAEKFAAALAPLLPESPRLFPADQVTDQRMAERAAEIVREALMERLGQELPYAAYVTVERVEEKGERLHLDAVIWVARTSQKGIVVGAGGRMVKAIGSAARKALEAEHERPVMLALQVRERTGWNDDPRLLSMLGLG